MKNLLYLSFIVVFISCTGPTLQGHWRCDKSGIVVTPENSQSLAEFYQSFGGSHFELVFHDDYSMTTKFVRVDGTSEDIPHTITWAYNGDDNDTKYKLLPNEGDESDESILTV